MLLVSNLAGAIPVSCPMLLTPQGLRGAREKAQAATRRSDALSARTQVYPADWNSDLIEQVNSHSHKSPAARSLTRPGSSTPLLARGLIVLPLVLADGAGGGRLVALGVLRPKGRAEEVEHVVGILGRRNRIASFVNNQATN